MIVKMLQRNTHSQNNQYKLIKDVSKLASHFLFNSSTNFKINCLGVMFNMLFHHDSLNSCDILKQGAVSIHFPIQRMQPLEVVGLVDSKGHKVDKKELKIQILKTIFIFYPLRISFSERQLQVT